MTKRKKQTVEYFQHDVNHGATIAALTLDHEAVGKNFWFSILELLGKTDGHYLDLSTDRKWKIFIKYCFVDTKTAKELFDILLDEEAIDYDLWTKEKGIWCQNFVDNLEPLYSRRKCELPKKPTELCLNSPAEAVVSRPETEVIPSDNPVASVHVHKAKESKEEKRNISTYENNSLKNVDNLLKTFDVTKFDSLNSLLLKAKETPGDLGKLKDLMILAVQQRFLKITAEFAAGEILDDKSASILLAKAPEEYRQIYQELSEGEITPFDLVMVGLTRFKYCLQFPPEGGIQNVIGFAIRGITGKDCYLLRPTAVEEDQGGSDWKIVDVKNNMKYLKIDKLKKV